MKKEKKNIILYENEQKVVYIYNRKTSQAFSIHKDKLIEKLRGIISLEYNKNINTLSLVEKQLIIDELEKSIDNDKKTIREDYKLTLNLYNILEKSCFLNIIRIIILCFFIPILLIGIIWSSQYHVRYGEREAGLSTLIIFLICLLGSIFVHEISHAIVAMSYGVFVPEMGFKLKQFNKGTAFPIFYTSVIGIENLDKYKRIKIFLAGPFANMFLIGIGLIFNPFQITFSPFLIMLNILMSISNFTVWGSSDAYNILKIVFDYKNLSGDTWNRLRQKKRLNKANITYLLCVFLSGVAFAMVVGGVMHIYFLNR